MFKLLKKLKKLTQRSDDANISGSEEKGNLPDSMHTRGGDERKLKDKGKLFVGGLNYKTTSAALEAHFSRFGRVVDAVVMRFPDTKRSRGYGFVTFADPSVADNLEGGVQTLDGNRIDIRAFASKSNRIHERRVFLGGIPFDITADKLRIFFARYGEVENVEIPRAWGTNKQKGYAFLTFKDKDAAEHCQADRFVYIGGKRVHIEKAVPKCPSAVDPTMPNSASVAEETEEEKFNSNSDSAGDVSDTDDSHSSGSGVLESSAKLIPGFEELMQNYYEKMSLFNQTKGNEKDGNWQSRDSDILKMEKLLTGLLIKDSGEDETKRKNLINFTSDVTRDTDEDTPDSEDQQNFMDEDDNACVNPVRSFPTDLCKPNTSSGGTLPDRLTKDIPNVIFWNKNSDFCLSQRSTAPFKVPEGAGCCSLCLWISPNGSTENLLNHYKTPEHQQKLKERFSQTNKPIDDDQQDIHSRLLSTGKTFSMTEERESKKERNVQTDKSKKSKEPDQKPQRQQQQKQGEINGDKRKKTKAKIKETDNLKGAKFNSEKDRIIISNEKVQELAKGMLFIQPTSENNLCCKMCNRIIPRAKNFASLMKNVSDHLQSKNHLSKLSEAEDSMKSQSSKNAANKTKETEKKVENPRQGDPGPGETGESGKGKTDKKKPEKDGTTHKTAFLCLICNFFGSDTYKINLHLNSKSHKEAHMSHEATCTFDSCEICKTSLYGSLYDINKHHSKCSGGKN